MSYTEGPWTMRYSTNENEGNLIYANRAIAATITEESETTPEDKANARLIAAAPELLAIVQHLADAQRDGAQAVYFGALFGDDTDVTTLGDAVTAAIAKAGQEEDTDES